ncbi:MAG: DedA family protein [Anaerolineaceae bacterium]
MAIFSFALDFVLHMDRYLGQIVAATGNWTYIVLFGVIFIETGLVVTPFLPGDSVLFASGALIASQGVLDVRLLYLIVAAAAILGDTANYWIGHFVGDRVFTEKSRFFKKEYLDRTHAFYEKHGGKTIFLARFIPIIRTFAPFVAGVGRMSYWHFLSYNVIGGILWPALFLFGGYYFGNIAFIKGHFSMVVIAIVLISLIPALVEFMRNRVHPQQQVS